MDKIAFTFSDTDETVEFFVLEQTRFQGHQYLLVTEDDTQEDADAYVMKDLSAPEDTEAVYEFVDDERELEAVSQIFAEILEDIDFETE